MLLNNPNTPGSSSGIGAATAVEFAKHGMRIMLHGRDEGRLREVVKKCKDSGAEEVTIWDELYHSCVQLIISRVML